jgi:5-hydroxyisourate hydrolase-like protein (transthyretin family)
MKSWRSLVCGWGVLLTLAGPVPGQNLFEAPRRPSGPYEIRGIVVDAKTEQPLAEVELSILESAQPAGQAFEVIQSDGNGRFRFGNLAEGKYTVQASRQGYAEQAFLQHENFWTGIAVGPGKDSLHTRFPLTPSATITGQVTDENGEPVRGANVTLWTERMENGVRRVVQTQYAATDDEGRYRIGHLLPGKYSASVSATPWYSRYVPDERRSIGLQNALPDLVYSKRYYPNVRDWHEMKWIVLQTGQVETADFHLIPEPSAHLLIHEDVSGNGQPPNVQLSTDLPGGGEVNVSAKATVSDSGEVELSGIPAGNYRVQMAGGPREISGEEQKVDLAGSSELRLEAIELSGSAIHGVIRMEEGDLKFSQALLQLKDAKGHTFDGVYFDRSGAQARPAAGSFVIENTPAGSQLLELSVLQPADVVVKKIEAKGAKVSGTTIEIEGHQEVSLIVTLAEGSLAIAGTVLKNGKPFAGAMVLLMPENQKDWERLVRRDQSDSDGTFRLAAILPGKYALIALANGWDIEWSKPEVLEPFLAKAQKLEIGKAQGSPVVLEVQ